MTWKTLIGRLAVSGSAVGALALAAGADSWDAATSWVNLILALLASLD